MWKHHAWFQENLCFSEGYINKNYIVASAVLADGTEKEEFTSFNIEFTYRKEYKVGNEYKFAIVCSSSKDGDRFKGAGGSTLTVDNFEVICE